MDPTDREVSLTRLTSYLRRRYDLAEPEARGQAEDLLTLIGGAPPALRETASRHWWLYALRGGLALIIGCLFLLRPGASLAALVFLFGAWAFVDGIFALSAAIALRRSWYLALVGILGIAVGVTTFFRPGITAIALYAAIATWTIAKGILEIGVSLEMSRALHSRGWLIADGVMSILIGFLFILLPRVGVLTLAWLIGFYALAFSGYLFALAVRLRRAAHPAEPHAPRIVPQPV